jgi:hypothetical protein
MRRREFGRLALASAALTAGCVPSSAAVAVSVTLAVAQAEAQAVKAALDAGAPALIAAIPAAQQAQATAALLGVNEAIGAFETLQAPTTPAAASALVVSAVKQVVTFLPLGSQAKLQIDAAVAIIGAVAAGLSTVTVPASTVTPAAPTAAAEPNAAPVRIGPLSS